MAKHIISTNFIADDEMSDKFHHFLQAFDQTHWLLLVVCFDYLINVLIAVVAEFVIATVLPSSVR